MTDRRRKKVVESMISDAEMNYLLRIKQESMMNGEFTPEFVFMNAIYDSLVSPLDMDCRNLDDDNKHSARKRQACENSCDCRRQYVKSSNKPPADTAQRNKDKADKALRKKLKKERQRDKKNSCKEKPEVTSVNDEKNNEIGTTTQGGKKKSKQRSNVDRHDGDNNDDDNKNLRNEERVEEGVEDKDNDDNGDNDDNDEEEENDDDDDDEEEEEEGEEEEEDESASNDIDFTIIPEEALAFVKSSITGKKDTIKMLKKLNDSVKGDDSIKEANHTQKKKFPDETDGFTCVKKGTKQAPASFCKTPEGFGNQALNVIRVGNFPLAIDYLTRAIALDPNDNRHYINRSYCHLRMGDYEQALSDTKVASQHFSDVTDRSRAKCREGQALCGLQNYEAAERAFRECLSLTPNWSYVKRELIRMQVMQLIHMGFNEREAILALEKQPDTMEAIHLLTENPSSNNDPYDSEASATDDEIFNSDTEECPSNERLMSKILNYDPNLPDISHIPELLPANKMINNLKQPPRAPSVERELRVIKTINPPAKPKLSNQSVNELAIWVGNMTPQITDSMLTKRFGKFGKVTKIWRSPSTTYTFVNFQSPASSKKALEEASLNGGNLDVCGNLLPIKHATTKTFY